MTKTLFITGASTGIGEATARAAVDAGYAVGLFARSEDRLASLAEQLGDRALALPGDVTDRGSLASALERFAGEVGGVGAVFANAGTGLDKAGVEGGDPDEWKAMLDVNVLGLLYTIKEALPYLKESKGHALLTGSAAGRRHLKGSIYGASKWFVHGFGGNLAEEMRTWGGRCTVIAPGMVDTPFFSEPKPDKLKPVDVANAVMHALTAPARCGVREVFLMPND
jgi:NADP-dependent 3-hydroxy acid dehydrogenase YdfG